MEKENVLTIRLGATRTYLVSGKVVIPTPGHTEGSLSVLAGSGNTFVGDIAVNMPLIAAPRYASPFGYSAQEMTSSLNGLIQAGAQRIYPAHGQPFSATTWLEKTLV